MARESPSKKHRSEPDPTALRVGKRVKALRVEADFSFDAFVAETGLGRGYVSELERGLVVPTVKVLGRIAEALELTIADLTLGDSPRERVMDMTRGMTEAEVLRLLDRYETDGGGGGGE